MTSSRARPSVGMNLPPTCTPSPRRMTGPSSCSSRERATREERGTIRPVRALDGEGRVRTTASDSSGVTLTWPTDDVATIGPAGPVRTPARRRPTDRCRASSAADATTASGAARRAGGQLVVARSGGGVEDVEDDHAGAGGGEAADQLGLLGPGPRPGGGRVEDGAGVDADDGHPRVELVGREEGVGRLALEAGEDRALQPGPAAGGDEGGDERAAAPRRRPAAVIRPPAAGRDNHAFLTPGRGRR